MISGSPEDSGRLRHPPGRSGTGSSANAPAANSRWPLTRARDGTRRCRETAGGAPLRRADRRAHHADRELPRRQLELATDPDAQALASPNRFFDRSEAALGGIVANETSAVRTGRRDRPGAEGRAAEAPPIEPTPPTGFSPSWRAGIPGSTGSASAVPASRVRGTPRANSGPVPRASAAQPGHPTPGG